MIFNAVTTHLRFVNLTRLALYRGILGFYLLCPTASILRSQEERLFCAEFYYSNGRLCREQVFGQIGDGQMRNTIFETDSARIAIRLPADIRMVQLQTLGKWEILFPPDAMFPNIGSHVWKVMLGDKTSSSPEDRILKELNKLKKQGVAEKEEILSKIQSSLQTVGQSTQAEIRQQLDSLLQLISEFQLENDRREALSREQQKLRRDATLELLDSTVQIYLSRVTDYKEEFRLRKAALFYDPAAVRFINERISLLNPAYECLNKNHGALTLQIQAGWESAEVQLLATRLLDGLLYDFHNKKVKEQGNQLLRDIDAHLKGAKGARKKKALRADLNIFIGILESEINRLGKDYDSIRSLLNAKS